jgi:hypothetical protein
MRPKVSLFDQAAEKLHEAMEGAATGHDRMRLIQEALMLYHLHEAELDEELDAGRGDLGYSPPVYRQA